MKSKDIVPLIIVIVISSILAYIASSALVDGTPAKHEIEDVKDIRADFPDETELEEIFHEDIIDTFGPIPLGDE